MAGIVLVCVDGSEHCREAVGEGLTLLDPQIEPVFVTVIDQPDETLVTGTGLAGGAMTDTEFAEAEAERFAAARGLAQAEATASSRPDAAVEVLTGRPGPAICDQAEREDVRGVILGTRGHGGVKRAVLGSVSDHVVRHAPCPVVVTGWSASDGREPSHR